VGSNNLSCVDADLMARGVNRLEVADITGTWMKSHQVVFLHAFSTISAVDKFGPCFLYSTGDEYSQPKPCEDKTDFAPTGNSGRRLLCCFCHKNKPRTHQYGKESHQNCTCVVPVLGSILFLSCH